MRKTIFLSTSVAAFALGIFIASPPASGQGLATYNLDLVSDTPHIIPCSSNNGIKGCFRLFVQVRTKSGTALLQYAHKDALFNGAFYQTDMYQTSAYVTSGATCQGTAISGLTKADVWSDGRAYITTEAAEIDSAKPTTVVIDFRCDQSISPGATATVQVSLAVINNAGPVSSPTVARVARFNLANLEIK